MVLTYSNIRFTAFSVLFVSVATSTAIFIFPLFLISFICSGFVLVFTGLSYGSFRIASSQYNHTVLFLNRVLRKIADSIPPSVGYSEIQALKIDKVYPDGLMTPFFNLLSPIKRAVVLPFSLLKYPFKNAPTEPIEEVLILAESIIDDSEITEPIPQIEAEKGN